MSCLSETIPRAAPLADCVSTLAKVSLDESYKAVKHPRGQGER